MQVTLDEKAGTITITMPIAPASSASGKSLVIASTHGNLATATTFKGKPVTIGVNAYTKN